MSAEDTIIEPGQGAPNSHGVPHDQGVASGLPDVSGAIANDTAAQQAQAAVQAVLGADPAVAAQPAMQSPSPIDMQAVPAPMQPTAPQPATAAPNVADEFEGLRPVPRVSIQAFCQSEGVAHTIGSAARDRRMSKAHVKTQMGSVELAIEYYRTAATPNLIVVESHDDGSQLVAQLDALAEHCDEGTNVVVIGHRNDVQLYRALIARGVSEYLVAPVSMGDFMRVVSDIFVGSESKPLGQTVAFIGAKGGVGSSTIAHNVAWTISSEFESDVILTDLDLAFGTANIDFDKDPAQGVAEAVFSSDRIDDTFLDRLLAKCSDHLSLLAAPSTLERTYDFGPADFAELIETAQRGSPNVVIDMPHVWTGWSREVLMAADRVVVTATPDLASLRNTKNLVDQLAEMRPNDPEPNLVLNQIGVPKRPEIGADDFARSLGIDVTATFGFEPALFGLAANNGQMIAETEAKSETAATILQLSQIVTGRRALVPEKKSTFSFFDRLTKKKSA